MAFKMKGSAFKLGDIATKSALKQTEATSPAKQNEVEEEYNPLNIDLSDEGIAKRKREFENTQRKAAIALNQARKYHAEADQEVGMSFTDETIAADKARLEELNNIRNKRAWTREEINEVNTLNRNIRAGYHQQKYGGNNPPELYDIEPVQ